MSGRGRGQYWATRTRSVNPRPANTNTGELRAHCGRCNRYFVNMRALEQHLRDSGAHYVCPGCDYDHDTRREMEDCFNCVPSEDNSIEYSESAGTPSGESIGITWADLAAPFGGYRWDSEDDYAPNENWLEAPDYGTDYGTASESISENSNDTMDDDEEARNREDQPYCIRCNRHFTSVLGYWSHCRMSRVHPWWCNECHTDFDREADLEAHKAAVHDVPSPLSHQNPPPTQPSTTAENTRAAISARIAEATARRNAPPTQARMTATLATPYIPPSRRHGPGQARMTAPDTSDIFRRYGREPLDLVDTWTDTVQADTSSSTIRGTSSRLRPSAEEFIPQSFSSIPGPSSTSNDLPHRGYVPPHLRSSTLSTRILWDAEPATSSDWAAVSSTSRTAAETHITTGSTSRAATTNTTASSAPKPAEVQPASASTSASTSTTIATTTTVEKTILLTCPLCLEEPEVLTSTLCGHVFCKECILAAVKVKHECPVCRAFSHAPSLHPIYLNITGSN